MNKRFGLLPVLACVAALLLPAMALPADVLTLPGVHVAASGAEQASTGLKLLLLLTVLSLVPAILVSMTGFVRIVIVLSLLRHALGMQETPPNTVLMSLALFLTLFTMSPVLSKANEEAFQPYMAGKLSATVAAEKGMAPLRDFMIRQTREEDLALLVEISHSPQPRSMADIGNLQLIPAFMLSELRTAFRIGFVIFLPFLLIDLIVSAILMGMGMMMVPPVTISLPLKLLMFVMIDGWNIVVRALLSSFN
ncbi:flagellar biosynthetic protein FliP [Andreprevotia lacus DSM 23236]|jgi:flagellar biosynthetic protein FliP|uniref:Flagellar biosynthetic protein FliP n=1 Tax=Andreprevotia lacus DSM 23236 TaxID=1121001 RepID=A0A1W1XUM5_9NEIS|nr:flagellar type III secretion system pore protein FliP [Andreprevotia lacus]SMC27659.1 flagellar biosynthetic protein FliP [Andreprevotia lacus DSM 23236]